MTSCGSLGPRLKRRRPAALLAVLLAAGALGAGAPVTFAQDAERRSRRSPVVDVFEQCRDAVVNISTTRRVQLRNPRFDIFDMFEFGAPLERERAVQSVGSGVVIHESGVIVTNAHVVGRASDVRVIFSNNQTLPAEIVAADPEHDLAVLAVRAERSLPAVRLGRSDDILVGETVVAIGNPLGLQHTVTAGIISALGRELAVDNLRLQGLLQTDAAINPGNSGGPLLNINGELIGIATAIRGDAQNVGFAIPVDRLWELVPQLLDIERRERVRFGLTVTGRAPRVSGVVAGSPAEQAGIRPGDVVRRFNGRELRSSIDYYVALLGQRPGARVELDLLRDDAPVSASVPLVEVPMPDGRVLAERLLGVSLEELPDRLRARYGLPETVRWVVEGVSAGSPAALAELRRGDMLVRVNGVAMDSPMKLGLTLENVRPGDRVVAEILRVERGELYFGPVVVDTRRDRR